jgi:Cd(II)/Pb(II)-responsive transcriptional regulator
MKIGELASRAGCDVQTVRYYERQGLLEEPVREASGYRRYGEPHLARLDFIRHCRALDIPLADVRQLLQLSARPDRSCAQVDRLIDSHIALVTQRIDSLQALRQQLVSLRQSCAGDPARPCGILQSFMSATREHACACHPTGTRAP